MSRQRIEIARSWRFNPKAFEMARISALLIVVVALTLGACGVKGPLEPPASAPPPQNDPFVLDPLL